MIGLFYDGQMSFRNGQLEGWVVIFKNGLKGENRSEK
jgi:hypothetical protein